MSVVRYAKEAPSIPTICRKGNSAQLLVDGRPFISLGGEIHNSSASDLAYMESAVWDKLVEHHCNVIFAPVYWELLEPEEGQFDFTLVDGLLAGARRRGLRMVILWFGTWKNGFSTYAPAWVKTDPRRFPRMEREPGRSCAALSSFGSETLRADARAFRELMKYLSIHDAVDRTVIMMQVENEPGLRGAPRDRSALADAAFASPIPADLHEGLAARQAAGTMRPELAGMQLGEAPRTWASTFGELANEAFMSWQIASFINEVAAEGRSAYPLPCYANSWLVQYPGQEPGEYPSGGPVSRMLDIWQIAGPELFALAPDIYLDAFAGICEDYAGSGNPLLIPEAGNRRRESAAHAIYAIGRHDALGFAPFGIDSMSDPLLARTYQLLGDLMPVISAHTGTGRMTAVVQGAPVNSGVGPAPGVNGAEKEVLLLEKYQVEVYYHSAPRSDRPPAAALIIEETPDSLTVLGLGGIDLNFSSREFTPEGRRMNVDYLSIEEGEYRDGIWQPGRRLNGDEYVLRFGDEPAIRRAKLYSYA